MRVNALIFLTSIGVSTAQVDNNDIRNRSVLQLNANPSRSNTAHNTVEWECLDKKLTEKCLVYHNDQWFSFKVQEAGDYFINISSQECRDKKGVQLIIIEGNPCEASTYQILECIPRIQQDDLFVELKKLKSGSQYLVNVDGFLGDFCEFSIQVSTIPSGLPHVSLVADTLEVAVKQKGKVVELSWELRTEHGKSVDAFSIYRRQAGQPKRELIRQMGTVSNTLGVRATKYATADTLPEFGSYKFEVYGLLADSHIPILVAEHNVTWSDANFHSRPVAKAITIATFPVSGKTGSAIEVILVDGNSDERLWARKINFDPSAHAMMQVDLAPWLKKTKRFLVLVIDETKREPVEYYFTTDRDGNVKRE